MSRASLCKLALNAGIKARDKYVLDVETWRSDIVELYRKKEVAESEVERLDLLLSQTPTNTTTDADGGDCDDWNGNACDVTCNNEHNQLQTPKGKLSSRYSEKGEESWTRPCSWGERKCHCSYVSSWDASAVNVAVAALEKIKADIVRKSNEYPVPAPIDVQCCSNEMGCNGGICYGNVQICESIIANLEKSENEPQMFENIINSNKTINELIININNNKPIIDTYYNNIQNIDYTKNYKLIYTQIKSIYDNATNNYNQIYKNSQDILFYIGNIKNVNARISATSTYKTESNKIMNDLVKNSSTIIKDFRAILDKYVYIKDIYTTINDEKNNYDIMLKNKKNIDEFMNSFNNNLDIIMENYVKIESYIMLNDDDLNKILFLVNTAKTFYNNLKENINNSNKYLQDTEILYETFNPTSIYIDLVNENLNNTKNTITLMDNKYNEIIDIINKINNIYLLKKNTYEKNKKIIYDENLLIIFEESEKGKEERIELELAILKLIEDENNMNDVNSNINITKDNNQDKKDDNNINDVNDNNQNKKDDNNQNKKDDNNQAKKDVNESYKPSKIIISVIIGAIAFVIILLVLFTFTSSITPINLVKIPY